MSKAITLIELFNKMASFDEQENLPEEIKYRDCVFTKIYGEGISPDYINKNSDTILEYVATEADDLNEIVEIIEEQEEIDIQELEELDKNLKFDDLKPPYGINEEMMWIEIIKQYNKINKLVQAVKQLDKKINDK